MPGWTIHVDMARKAFDALAVGRHAKTFTLERDGLSSNRHPAPAYCLSMIFFENRYPTFPDHAPSDLLPRLTLFSYARLGCMIRPTWRKTIDETSSETPGIANSFGAAAGTTAAGEGCADRRPRRHDHER
jgi:hypothetical protein